MSEDLNEKELSPEDTKLLVEFFTILAEWDAQKNEHDETETPTTFS